jgi:hypothetical protein
VSLDTFYELACGDQPKGKRGIARSLDIDTNGIQALRWLDMLFAKPEPALAGMRRPAYGNAYLALAMLNDQPGHWTAARRYMFLAIESNPRLLSSYRIIRRLLKLYLGERLVNVVKARQAGWKRVTP